MQANLARPWPTQDKQPSTPSNPSQLTQASYSCRVAIVTLCSHGNQQCTPCSKQPQSSNLMAAVPSSSQAQASQWYSHGMATNAFQVLNQWALQELLLQEETTHPDANAAVIYKYMEPGVVCDSQGVMYALRKLVLLNQRLNSLARPSPFEKRSCFCLPATHFMPNGCKHHKASPVTVRQPGQEPGQVPADHDKFITYFCEECTTCMRCHKYHGWN